MVGKPFFVPSAAGSSPYFLAGCMSLPGGKGKSRLTLVIIVLPRDDSPPRPKSICFGNAYFEGRICGLSQVNAL